MMMMRKQQQEVDNTKRRAVNGTFFDAISEANTKIPRLMNMCLDQLHRMLAPTSTSSSNNNNNNNNSWRRNFGNDGAFLRNVRSGPCLDMILSKCDTEQLKMIQDMHREEDVILDTDGIWEQLCYKKWGKSACKSKPLNELWQTYYEDRLQQEEDRRINAKRILEQAKQQEEGKQKKELKSMSIHSSAQNEKRITVNRVVRDVDGRRVQRQMTTVVHQEPVRRKRPASSSSSSSSSSFSSSGSSSGSLGGAGRSSLWAKAERDMATSVNTSTGFKMGSTPGVMTIPKNPHMHMVSQDLMNDDTRQARVIRRPPVINAPTTIDLSKSRPSSPDHFDGIEPSPVTPKDIDKIFGRKSSGSKKYDSIKKKTDTMRAPAPKRQHPAALKQSEPKRTRSDDYMAASRQIPPSTSTTSSRPAIRNSEFGSIKIPKKSTQSS